MMVFIVLSGLLAKGERRAEVRLFRPEGGTRTCIVALSSRWRRVVVLSPGCGESAKMAVKWLKYHGVMKIDEVFCGCGSMERRGMKEWMRRIPVQEVVVGEEWRNCDDVRRWTGAGIHVSYYNELKEGKKEYRHGREALQIWEEGGGLRVRYENCDGCITHYNEEKNGLGIMSCLDGRRGGYAVVGPQAWGMNMYVAL